MDLCWNFGMLGAFKVWEVILSTGYYMGRKFVDKDSIILKYEQEEVGDVDNEIEKLHKNNFKQSEQLEEIQEKIKNLYALLGKKPAEIKPEIYCVKKTETPQNEIKPIANYEDLYKKARMSLRDRGLDVDNLDYHDLISEGELREIEQELNRPLDRKEKWTKSDFIVVFIAASIGSMADYVLSDRNNKFTGKGSKFSEWLNEFHKHDSGGPIDYQGKGFGGGYHRELSRGHDILRFIEAIMMFKNGEFIGIRHENGIPIKVVSKTNQYGTPYEQLSTIEAIVKYAQHMFADLFSTCSLPFPGSSFLAECDNRQLRKFAAEMYQNGFNCKNIIIQALSTIVVEIIIRIYYSIQSVQKYKCDLVIAEDYSNIEALKKFFKPEGKEKLNEMLLVAHAIVLAFNVGKVVIKKAPWEINIVEIFSVVKYGVKVLKNTMQRHSEYAKLMRNSDVLHEKWKMLDEQVCTDKDFIREMKVPLII